MCTVSANTASFLSFVFFLNESLGGKSMTVQVKTVSLPTNYKGSNCSEL